MMKAGRARTKYEGRADLAAVHRAVVPRLQLPEIYYLVPDY